MTDPILNTHNKEEYAPAHTAEHLQSMSFDKGYDYCVRGH